MSNKLFNHRLFSLIISIKRSVNNSQTKFDLGYEMKLLNEKKQFKKTLNLFDQHKEKYGEISSNLIITQGLKACSQLGDFKHSSDIINLISSKLKNDSYVLASLIHYYMKCNDIKNAERLFYTSTNKSLGMYGAMMKGYINNHQANKSIDLFHQIKNPDEVIYIILFNACAQLATNDILNLVKSIWQKIPKSFCKNSRLSTSVLDALMKCRDVTYAETLFNQSTNKVLSMYGAMINGYIINNEANKAINLFHEISNPDEITLKLFLNACAHLKTNEALILIKKMSPEIYKKFQSNARVLACLCDALIKCGDCSSAEMLFFKMKKFSSGYGNLINGYIKENNPEKALNLFNQMKIDGVEINYMIYTSILNALSEIGDYSLSQSIVQQIPGSFFIDNKINNALMDMWGKVGCVKQAEEVFEKISARNDVAYTIMINCYGLNGQGVEAIKLYRKIPSELINESTYVCVLKACSHSGLIEEARLIFKNIKIKTVKIYTSMIDCFSRASFFEEAQRLIDEFEVDHAPSSPMYMSLLSSARNVNNVHLSQKVYDRIQKLFSESTDLLITASILQANTYTASGEIDKASDIRIQLHKSSSKKKVGLSWTVVNGKIYRFKAQDTSHPHSFEIYLESEKISNELIVHGHQYDASCITRPLNEDETVTSILSAHSERLAVAWNFVANPNTRRIQVIKNLRICLDCHRAIKLIALIRQCEIIVRDANRIHHFYTNGQCSCNDYF